MGRRTAALQRAARRLLLGTHRVVLGGLLVLAILIGYFPIVVVCDDGRLLRCVGDGVLAFGIVAGPSLLTVGLANLALMRPGRHARIFLALYSIALMGCIFYFPGWTRLGWFMDGLAALGLSTLLCLVFADAGGKHP